MINKAVFDLTCSGELCHGELTFENGVLVACCNGEEVFSQSVEGFSELKQRVNIGCGSLELVPEGAGEDYSQSTEICRFSMTCVAEIGEFCKVVNHFIESGEETELSRSGIRVCPKCGRHLITGIDVCLFCVEKKDLLLRCLKMMKPYTGALIFASVFVMLSNAMTAFIPLLNSRLLDNYLYSASEIGADAAIKGVIITAVLMVITQAAGQIFKIFGQRSANKAGSNFSNDLRILVYDKAQRLSLTSMSKRTSGDLIKRITNDTQVVRNFMTNQGLMAVQRIVMFIVVFVILWMTSPILTIMVLAPVPLSIFLIRKAWGFMRLRYHKQWRYASRANSILHDIIKGIRVVKTFGNEEREVRKFARACKRFSDMAASNEHMWAMIIPYLSFFLGIGEFMVFYFGGRMVLNGTMTVGELLQFSLFLTYIYAPLRWFSSLPRWISEAMTSLVKIFEIIDEKSADDEKILVGSADLKGDIVFDNVTFGYKTYEPVLKDVNLTVKQGEMIGLVGHSGAGKSTLINLIMRLYETDEGDILVNSTKIKDIEQGAYRERIGTVFQQTFLFSGTVYDNIAYAKRNATPDEVIAAAKAANAHEFIIRLPDGYNTLVGENGHNLSGGERQRVAIARAVLRDPDILILDEATSALDPETEGKIQEALARLIKGRTTIAIAHRLSTLRNADRLVVIEKGRIAEVGTHRELLMLDGIYAKLVMAQRQTAKLSNAAE